MFNIYAPSREIRCYGNNASDEPSQPEEQAIKGAVEGYSRARVRRYASFRGELVTYLLMSTESV